jgi:hypothetical protein
VSKLLEFVIELSVKAADAVSGLSKIDKSTQKTKDGLNNAGDAAERLGYRIGSAMNSAGKFAARVGTKLANVANLAATAIAPMALQFGRNAMLISREAEESASKFGAVYGKAAQSAGAEIDKLADKVGRSATKLRAASADTQGQLRGIGFEAGEAAKMSQQVTEAALDLASFANKSDADATRSIQGALLGNAESIKEQFGIIAMETQVAQKLAEQGIKAKAASEMQKVEARLAIIKDQMKRQGSTGDAARTKSSTANTAKASDDKIYEAQLKAGEKLKELDRQIQIIKGGAADLFLGMNDSAKTAVVGVVGLLSVLSPLITVYQLLAIKKATDAVATLANTTATGANTAANTANTTSRWAMIAAKIRGGAAWLVSTLAAKANTVALWVNNAAQKAWALGSTLVTGAARLITTAFNVMKVALLSNPIVLLVTAIATAAYLIYSNWGPISAWFAGIWATISAAAAAGWNAITTKFNEGIAWLSALPGRFLAIGQGIMSGLVNGISNGVAWVRDKILGLASQVSDWFKDALGINSPSLVFSGFGGGITEGLARGIDKTTRVATQAADRLAMAMSSPQTGFALAGAANAAKVFYPRMEATRSQLNRPVPSTAPSYSRTSNSTSINHAGVSVTNHINGARDPKSVAREVGRELDRRSYNAAIKSNK